MSEKLVSRIDALLPQTQCGKCGHPGCRPYALAVAQGESHNHCPPGGQATADALADVLNRPRLPLDDRGYPNATAQQVAFIREAECIGCTKCIQACPVDAIVGAAKLMHTVIADECTGCDLCVAPCPVDCIDMRPRAPSEVANSHSVTQPVLDKPRADHARARFQAREVRLERLHAEKEQRRRDRQAANRTAVKAVKAVTDSTEQEQEHKQQLRLKTAYRMAHKQHQQAQAALERARRQGSPQLDTMATQVEALRKRAEQCRQRLEDAQ